MDWFGSHYLEILNIIVLICNSLIHLFNSKGNVKL